MNGRSNHLTSLQAEHERLQARYHELLEQAHTADMTGKQRLMVTKLFDHIADGLDEQDHFLRKQS